MTIPRRLSLTSHLNLHLIRGAWSGLGGNFLVLILVLVGIPRASALATRAEGFRTVRVTLAGVAVLFEHRIRGAHSGLQSSQCRTSDFGAGESGTPLIALTRIATVLGTGDLVGLANLLRTPDLSACRNRSISIAVTGVAIILECTIGDTLVGPTIAGLEAELESTGSGRSLFVTEAIVAIVGVPERSVGHADLFFLLLGCHLGVTSHTATVGNAKPKGAGGSFAVITAQAVVTILLETRPWRAIISRLAGHSIFVLVHAELPSARGSLAIRTAGTPVAAVFV